MNYATKQRDPRRGAACHRTRARRATVAAALFASFGLLTAVGAAPARASTCSDCAEPSDSALVAASGYPASEIGGLFGKWLSFAGAECSITVKPAGDKTVGIELFWSARGEAWNCPDSSSDSTIRVDLGDMSSFKWHVDSTGGLKLGADELGSILASFSSGSETGNAQRIAGGIAQTIHAKDCHRVEWVGYFFVAKVERAVDVSVQRRYHWWVKETSFSSEVLRSGDVFVDCGSGRVSAGCLVPISAHVALFDRNCGGCSGGAAGSLGFFPPLPPGVPAFDPFAPPPPPAASSGPTPPTPPTPKPPEPASPPEPSDSSGAAGPTGPASPPAPDSPRPPMPDDPDGPAAPPTPAPGDGDNPAPRPPDPDDPNPFDPFSPWMWQGAEPPTPVPGSAHDETLLLAYALPLSIIGSTQERSS